jgi:hypothetical protein
MKLENYLRGGRRSSLGANGGLHAQESIGGWLGNGEVESKERDREEKRREEKEREEEEEEIACYSLGRLVAPTHLA